jgi:hypothetical protein
MKRRTGSVLFAVDQKIDLKKVLLAALMLSAFMVSAAAAYDYTKNGILINGIQESNSTFTFEQSVQGNGFFMTYMYAKQGNLAMKNYAHGSGSVDNSMILSTYKDTHQWHPNGEDWNDYTMSCIQFKESVADVYAPMSIAVGTGFYAANPIDYSSLLKEKTWIKNYMAASSIHHEIEYAHAIDKDLEFTAKEKFNHTYDPELTTVAVTQFKVNEDVTDGKVHFGVLQGSKTGATSVPASGASISDWINPDFTLTTGLGPKGKDGYAWKNPAIEIDEDYWGTYHIEKNITLEVPYKKVTKSDDWLPCCFGGYLTMPTNYQKGGKGFGGNVKGVFDCTCFKAPMQAQYPRIY